MRLTLEWEPDLDVLGEMLTQKEYPNDWTLRADPKSLRTARELLEWTQRRLEHAEEMGVERSVYEICMAVMRLQERRLIETQ